MHLCVLQRRVNTEHYILVSDILVSETSSVDLQEALQDKSGSVTLHLVDCPLFNVTAVTPIV